MSPTNHRFVGDISEHRSIQSSAISPLSVGMCLYNCIIIIILSMYLIFLLFAHFLFLDTLFIYSFCQVAVSYFSVHHKTFILFRLKI